MSRGARDEKLQIIRQNEEELTAQFNEVITQVEERLKFYNEELELKENLLNKMDQVKKNLQTLKNQIFSAIQNSAISAWTTGIDQAVRDRINAANSYSMNAGTKVHDLYLKTNQAFEKYDQDFQEITLAAINELNDIKNNGLALVEVVSIESDKIYELMASRNEVLGFYQEGGAVYSESADLNRIWDDYKKTVTDAKELVSNYKKQVAAQDKDKEQINNSRQELKNYAEDWNEFASEIEQQSQMFASQQSPAPVLAEQASFKNLNTQHQSLKK